jgi:nitrogen-specific signal transduction histidine kinase
MIDERSAAIPLDEFPDPVLAYAVEGHDGRITTVNEAFERRFDDVAPDASVSAVFDRFSAIDTSGDEDPLTHLVRGDRVGIYLDGERGSFFGRVIPSDENAGYLVFSDLGQCPDVEDPPAVDGVSSVISHDLRNPLDVAKAHLQAARETGDPEHFESISSAHDRMERIVRDVLTLTRGDAVVDPSERVSVETAATEAWESVETDRATLELSDSLPTTTADPDRIRRLFENLFRNSVEHGSTTSRSDARGNSVEHGSTDNRRESAVERGSEAEDAPNRDGELTPESGVTITVGTLADGFYVADDGPGIPPGEREVVFEPGYSTREGGTGLGLAIVERIVAAHDWEMDLTTAEHGGVRFEIRFHPR